VNKDLNAVNPYLEAWKSFFYQINTRQGLRMKLLSNPRETLVKFFGEFDIEFDEMTKRAAEAYVEELKARFTQKDLIDLPVGWEDHRWEIEEGLLAVRIIPSDDDDPVVL
jgi:hypothetical protein